MIVTILKNQRSRSAIALRNSLRAELGHNTVSAATKDVRRRALGDRFIINWGVGLPAPHQFRQRSSVISNDYGAVMLCKHKKNAFVALNISDVPTLEWEVVTADPTYLNTLRRWLEEDGKIVVRHVVNGHSGAGIQIVRRGEEIPNAPLYTRYFRKHAEYRVHVAFGEVILIQQKRKRNGFFELVNQNKELVRTAGNGWVFTINALDCDARNYRTLLCNIAIAGASAVGVNHGAVDILVNHDTDQMVVCEINSAPALRAESTLFAYTNAFVRKYKEIVNG